MGFVVNRPAMIGGVEGRNDRQEKDAIRTHGEYGTRFQRRNARRDRFIRARRMDDAFVKEQRPHGFDCSMDVFYSNDFIKIHSWRFV